MTTLLIHRSATTPRAGHEGCVPRTASTFVCRDVAAGGLPPRPACARRAASAEATVRRVQAADAEAFQAFIMGLSAVSRRMRFHGVVNSCSPPLLRYLTETDGVRHQAWLAFDGRDEREKVVGEARFILTADGRAAELAIAVADAERGRGTADRLLQTLVAAASCAGVDSLFADVLDDNARMFGFLRRHGFEIDPLADVDIGVERWQRRLNALGGFKKPHGAGRAVVAPMAE